MNKIIIVSIIAIFVFCTSNNPVSNGINSGNTVSVIVNFSADPPDGQPEQCFIYSNGINVKTFLYNGVDTITVSDKANLTAEYYKKYVVGPCVIHAVAVKNMRWDLR